MDFVKMQTLGNDYILIDCLGFNKEAFINLKDEIKQISNRYFGIGASGVVFIMNSESEDVKMLMFNQNGIKRKISAEAIRCGVKYLYDSRIITKEKINIETEDEIKEVILELNENKTEIENIVINIGIPKLSTRSIPVMSEKSILVNEPITICGKQFKITCVSIDEPHTVCFVKNIDLFDINKYALRFENYYRFPERTNVDFVEIVDNKTIKIRTWIRGIGEVLSNSNAACASIVASTLNHYLNKNIEITVLSKGGEQKVKYMNDGNLILEGNAEFVFEGKKYQISK